MSRGCICISKQDCTFPFKKEHRGTTAGQESNGGFIQIGSYSNELSCYARGEIARAGRSGGSGGRVGPLQTHRKKMSCILKCRGKHSWYPCVRAHALTGAAATLSRNTGKDISPKLTLRGEHTHSLSRVRTRPRRRSTNCISFSVVSLGARWGRRGWPLAQN